MVLTDELGNYIFENLPAGQTYNVKSYYNGQAANGISSTDLVLTARHILDLTMFSDPYQLIAADVNNNGSISASDLVQMKRVLLGLSDTFSNNSSWRFLDATFSFTGLDTPVREIIMIELMSDTSNVNFIGVKIGDVNGNCQFGSEVSEELRFVFYKFDKF